MVSLSTLLEEPPVTRNDRSAASDSMPTWLVIAAAAGATVALFGGFWDDAYHTERGRDGFFIAPHLLIYGGIAAVGGALVLRLVQVARGQGVAAIAHNRALLLAAVSVAATMASGPIDNVWHLAFGRDAVLWSPPHMLGIVGTLALGAALLHEIAERTTLHAVVGGLVLAAAVFPVAEYDTDVPQFASVWYLPAMTLGVAVAFAFTRLTSEDPWTRTRAAAVHLLFIGAVSAFLVAEGFDAPGLMVLIVPALAVDVAERRRASPLRRAVVLVLALVLIYVPIRNWLGDGVQFSSADVLVGGALSLIAALAVSRAAAGTAAPRLSRRLAGMTLPILLLIPATALAHDPGQGKDAGSAEMRVSADGDLLQISGRLPDCKGLDSGSLVARRAGREKHSALRVNGCGFAGSVRVDQRGRWFVYADLRSHGRTVESWLPVHAENGREVVSDPARFAYEPRRKGASTLKYAGGTVLYLAMLGLLAGCFVLLRPRQQRERPQGATG